MGSNNESGIRKFDLLGRNEHWIVNKDNFREFIEAIGVHSHLNNDDITKLQVEVGENKLLFRQACEKLLKILID